MRHILVIRVLKNNYINFTLTVLLRVIIIIRVEICLSTFLIIEQNVNIIKCGDRR